MDAIPAAAVAFPALWLFILGLVLTLGVFRMRRARLDLRDDWNRLIRFHDALKKVEATRGRDEPARVELLALARALDEAVEPAEGRPALGPQVERFDPGGPAGPLMSEEAQALGAALRRDVVAVDRVLQERMKAGTREQGHLGRVFLAGAGGILLLPLMGARRLGLVERLTARRVEASLWFHAALGVVVFVVLAGTVFAALAVGRVVTRLLAA